MAKKTKITPPSRPRLSSACKVCRLVQTQPDLWTRVHDMILKEGMSQRSVMIWLNSQLEVINVGLATNGEETIKAFNEQNFSKHFRNHIDSIHTVTSALKHRALGRQILGVNSPNTYSAEDLAVAEDYLQDQQELTDYTQLTKMIGTLEDYLWKHNEDLQKKDLVPLTQLSQFKDLIQSVADLKMRLSKIRNSSVVAGAAVRKAVATSVAAFLNQLVTSTQDAANSFQEAFPEGVNVSAELLNKLRDDVASGMKQVLEEIVEEVFHDFKIK